MKKLSILIPVFNKKNFTISCLKDLSALNADEVEILVVDNASTDGTGDEVIKLQESILNLSYIRNEQNLGFGKALNRAYARTSGEYVLFLNNDIRVESRHDDWVEPLIAAAGDSTIVGPTGAALDERPGFSFLFESNDSAKFKHINYISGWCMLAKRSEFDKLILKENAFKGPWRDKIFAYHEDPDLCWRAMEQGFKLKMVSVPVKHFGKITSSQLNVSTLYKASKKIFSDIWLPKLDRR